MDHEVAGDWFAADLEAWQKLDIVVPEGKLAGCGVVRPASRR